jgi:hypothetical protein
MAIKNGTPGNDVLIGTQEADSIFGFAGNDNLLGLRGTDSLDGGDGNDTLNGGNDFLGSRETLLGGRGNDTYIIKSSDPTFIVVDEIVEAANSGTDTVRSFVTYTLGLNLENLKLAGVDASSGTGNDLNNTIIGNAANNLLNGLTGNDNLDGRAGNDTLLAGSGVVGERDTLTGGTGRDTFLLGNVAQVFYDDHNPATAGTGDYALITDLNTTDDVIKLNGRRMDYRLAASPAGLPIGTAIYRNKPTGEPDELIAIVQGSSGLNLSGKYFKFTADEVYLSTLDGNNGFVINGIDQRDVSGFSVSDAGDINGDGFDELLIGAPGADLNGQHYAGASYVVFGKPGGFSTSLNLSSLNGNNGFVINGIDVGDDLGKSVSSAGDINGDGFDDLLIVAPGADPNGQSYAGESYVVFGKAGSFGASFDLSTLNGRNGFVINSSDDNPDDYSNISASDAGDVNGDGFDDLLVGVPNTTLNGQINAGSSYVVFGKVGGFSASLNLSDIDGSNGFVINGIDEFDRSGFSVSSAGDVNSDGFDDLLIRASGADFSGQSYAGESYVVFGKSGDFGTSLNLSALNGSNGFVINGIDGYDRSDRSIISAGDINGDGFSDIILGATFADTNGQLGAGESYVVFGKAGGFGASLNLSTLNGSNGFVINGIDEFDRSGSVSSAGDVNGDGFDDLLIGAHGADPNGQSFAGESYVVFGKAGGFGTSFNLSDINGSNGFVINGIDPGDYSGQSVSTAGDINGDGFDDLLIGANGADLRGQYDYDLDFAGESYVVFGRDFTNSVTQTGTEGNDTLTGNASDEILIGGLGNDRLSGGLGIDVLIGGAGDDIISFGATDRRLNGSSGTDTLRIDTSGINLDLNNRLSEFEIIDITGTGNNSLTCTRLDVLNLSDTTNRLIVNGNSGDTATSTGQGWTLGGTTTLNGILYDRYTVGAATLLVDTDITQTIT